MKKSLFLGAALLATASTLSAAEDARRPATPLTSIKAGEPVRMTYELRANAWLLFLPITGKARFTADIEDRAYKIDSKVKTTGLADILVNYDLTLSASGYVRGDELDTYAYVSQNRDGKKNRRVEMTYGKTDVAMTAKPEFGDLGEPPATPAQKLGAKDPITALISFGLEPRDVEAAPCGGPLKIFDGRQLTYLHLDYAGRRNIKTDAWRGEAIECHVTMEKVAGYDADEIDEQDNLTAIDGPLKMYLAELPNGATPLVRLEADSKDIGKVVLQTSVLKFEPLVKEEASAGASGG